MLSPMKFKGKDGKMISIKQSLPIHLQTQRTMKDIFAKKGGIGPKIRDYVQKSRSNHAVVVPKITHKISGVAPTGHNSPIAKMQSMAKAEGNPAGWAKMGDLLKN